MERARDQDARQTPSCKFGQIFAAAHAAGGEDLPRSSTVPDFIEPYEIGAGVATDTAQRHDDHAGGPEIRLGQEPGRTQEAVVAEIERQGQPILRYVVEPAQKFRVIHRLAANHERPRVAFEPVPAGSVIGQAAIHPQLQLRESALQVGNVGIVTAFALDRRQIGDVQDFKRINVKEPGDHVGRAAAAA